jgi:hypothetical protein
MPVTLAGSRYPIRSVQQLTKQFLHGHIFDNETEG